MRLPVYTESGEHLGRVHDAEIDLDTHAVRKYVVAPRFIGRESYLITPVQIKAVTDKKIIVEDTILKDTGVSEAKPASPEPSLGGLMPRSKN